MADTAIKPDLTDGRLTTGDIGISFEGFINKADAAVEKFIQQKSPDGNLNLSSADSLQLQRLMSDQSIAAQTGTSTLKAVKDNIIAAARNI